METKWNPCYPRQHHRMTEIKGIWTDALVSVIVSTTVGGKKRISELQGTAVYSNKLPRRCLNEVVFNVLNASKEGPYRSSSSSTSWSPYVSPFPELIKLSYFTFSEIVRRARPPNSRKFKGFLGKSQLQTEYRQLQRGISPQKLRNINYTYSQTTT